MRNKGIIRKSAGSLLEDEAGIGVIELVLILVVLIGLVIIFKEQITKLLESIFKEINSQSKGCTDEKAGGDNRIFGYDSAQHVRPALWDRGIRTHSRRKAVSAHSRKCVRRLPDGPVSPGTLGNVPDFGAGAQGKGESGGGNGRFSHPLFRSGELVSHGTE